MHFKEQDQFIFRNPPGLLHRTRSAGLEPATQGLEIPCSIQLSYERKCTGLKDGKVNLGWRKVNRRSRRARHAFPTVKIVNHSTERSRRPQGAENLTQRRQDAKRKMDFEQEITEVTEISVSFVSSHLKVLRLVFSYGEKRSESRKRSSSSPQPCQSESTFLLNLCAFASLREIFPSLWPL